MKRVILACLISTGVCAQELVPITAQWTTVTTKEDGTPIDPGDLTYAVIVKANMYELCSTYDTQCSFPANPGDCGTIYAVARQISTGLQSDPSNTIDICADDFINRLIPPVLEFIIGSR